VTRSEIAATTKRYHKTVAWLLAIGGVCLVAYFLVISPGRSSDPMLTPLGSRFDYMVTAPAFLAYIGLLYAWSVWLAVFTAPPKELMASLSTILTGVAIWLWTLDVAGPVVLMLLLLGLAHGAVMIGHALHRDSSKHQV
jgi:hypothetical protein